MAKYEKCTNCGKVAIHLAITYVSEFYGDQDDNEGQESKYADQMAPLNINEVSLFAHICFECGHLVDVGIEQPREKAINTSTRRIDDEIWTCWHCKRLVLDDEATWLAYGPDTTIAICQGCYSALGKPADLDELYRSSNEKLVNDLANLFDEIGPDTPEEIDAVLRESGYDPDEVGSRFKAAADEALAKYAPKLEGRKDK